MTKRWGLRAAVPLVLGAGLLFAGYLSPGHVSRAATMPAVLPAAPDGPVLDALAAARRDAGSAAPYLRIAELDERNQRRHEAIRELQSAVCLKPADASMHYALACAYDAVRRSTPAIAEYGVVSRLDPRHPLAPLRLGSHLTQRCLYVPAERALRLALRLNPNSVQAHAAMADLFSQTQRDGQAIAEDRWLIHQTPNDLVSQRQLLELLDKTGRYDAAILAGEHLLSLDPSDEGAMDTVADCYLNKGQWRLAQAYSRRALSIDPSDADAHIHTGIVYLNQGKQAAALAEWRLVAAQNHCRASYTACNLIAQHS